MLLLASCLFNSGCGNGKTTGRVPVAGKITAADGRAIDGSISFLPLDGRPGPAANGRVLAGEYQFDSLSGPFTGPHRIILIENPAATKGQSVAGTTGPSLAATRLEHHLEGTVPEKSPYRLDLKLPDDAPK